MSTNRCVKYRNGNYYVYLDLIEGTKVRVLDEGEEKFRPDFPEGCDILISNYCERGCPYCYAGCSTEGIHAPIPQLDFEPYTEIAINLNYPLHPGLEEFLRYQQSRHVLVNATVNQDDLIQNEAQLWRWQTEGLITALGVSYTGPHEDLDYYLSQAPRILHVIAGVFSEEDHKFLTSEFNKPPKILILGFKDKHRGKDYLVDNLASYEKNTEWLTHNLGEVMESYPVVGFDNVAIETLDVKSVVGDAIFKRHYMGDEGEFTFAIDLVKGGYARSSQEPDSAYKPIGNLTPTEMFQNIRR